MAECGGPSPAEGSGRTWCLRRVGMSGQWLLLESGGEVTVGRGFGLTYQLVSKTCPLMISRYHCAFKQNAQGQWTVTDNKSLNGVWLNKERLDPFKAYTIGEGDHIQLGVPLDNKETAEYEYEVIKEEWEKVCPFLAPRNDQVMGKAKGARTKRKLSLEESEASGAEGPSDSRSKRDRVSCDSEPLSKSQERAELAKQQTENMDVKLPSPGPSMEEDDAPMYCIPVNSEKAVSLRHKDQKASSLAQSWTGLEMLRKTLGDIMKLKVKMEEKKTAILSVRKSRKSGQKEIKVMEQELQELQNQLCTEQEHQQQRVEQLERTFYEEQQQLLEGVKKQQGEENLKEQLAQVLQEHRALMDELSRSKKDFEEIIQAKNKELEETKEEKEKARAQKEEVLSQMNDVLENELQCTICSEYFIEAVTLNCAHSFCSYCINEWMKRKVECPICRREIQSKTRSLVLDNCIDRMVENLNLEMKEHRLALIRERKVKMKRRAETEFSINQKKQKKRAEDLGLNLSSTSDDEPPFSNHATQESSSSGSGSDSESEEKRPVFGSDSNEFKADSLVEGTSSRYSMYNSVSQKLMAKMGFREGEGLGKYSQGRKDIVETSNQKGRRGLGLTLKGFDGDLNIDWRDEPEICAAWVPAFPCQRLTIRLEENFLTIKSGMVVQLLVGHN
ncbi:cap-specific mRNA (nucleoside-2'-O-)-methyltransferase 1 isoform X5 [Pelodiscus sinensis]|uniref:cap-specific mRNA (nucleoside-2'-O-)-methyltransferase 1 isoform X5 n=1 Tax=Pelodiscus sinensis TaxID=13735 RepID=UPI003F6CCB13